MSAPNRRAAACASPGRGCEQPRYARHAGTCSASRWRAQIRFRWPLRALGRHRTHPLQVKYVCSAVSAAVVQQTADNIARSAHARLSAMLAAARRACGAPGCRDGARAQTDSERAAGQRLWESGQQWDWESPHYLSTSPTAALLLTARAFSWRAPRCWWRWPRWPCARALSQLFRGWCKQVRAPIRRAHCLLHTPRAPAVCVVPWETTPHPVTRDVGDV